MHSPPSAVTKILLCDDHKIFCEGLQSMISMHLNIAEIHLCHNVANCSKALKESFYEVLICDININGESGLKLIENHSSLLTQTNIIILSGFTEEYLVKKAIQLGVNHYLKKETGITDLLSAIQNHAPSVSFEKTDASAETIRDIKLSKQEKEVIKLITQGLLSKEIADQLHISKLTVDTHRRNIHRKLHTSNTADLLKLVYEGILEV